MGSAWGKCVASRGTPGALPLCFQKPGVACLEPCPRDSYCQPEVLSMAALSRSRSCPVNWHGQIAVVLPLDAAFSGMLETELGPPPSLGVGGGQNLRQEGRASSRGCVCVWWCHCFCLLRRYPRGRVVSLFLWKMLLTVDCSPTRVHSTPPHPDPACPAGLQGCSLPSHSPVSCPVSSTVSL